MDLRLWWIFAFGSDKDLRMYVSEPAMVRDNIENCVLLFSDQVPWWVKVKSSRQLYSSKETRSVRDNERETKQCNVMHSVQDS